ncbi:MAG: hypothetical protein FWG03_02375 [Clostridiales bacterium]|nr:hypothetical protein [Clostridiales bacterium]
MPFSTKATLVAFQGDAERYPCHAMLDIGSELVFDGGELHGKMCPDMLAPLSNALYTLYMAGPRFQNPGYYNMFWYTANSVFDPEKKAYDGNGWTPINKEYNEPEYHIRCLQPPTAFHWPPSKGRPVMKDYCVMCPDGRTGAVFKIEAFDLATGGHATPYFRREITIMDRVYKTGGAWPIEKITDLFSEFELNEVYPTLVQELVGPMVEELELLGFARVDEGMVTITQKGADRVARFKSETTPDVVKALKL